MDETKEQRAEYIEIGKIIGGVHARLKNIETGIQEIKETQKEQGNYIAKQSRNLAVINKLLAVGGPLYLAIVYYLFEHLPK